VRDDDRLAPAELFDRVGVGAEALGQTSVALSGFIDPGVHAIGHHKPSFTLDVYGSLMDEGVGQPLDLDAELTGAELAQAVTHARF
jgi:hypothetical protein